MTGPGPERRIAPDRTVGDALAGAWTTGGSVQTLGFDPQPPARTWRLRLDAALTARDGQTLGYPWLGFVENGHAPPFIAFEGAVWESAGGPQLPLIARNVSSITRSLAPITPSSLIPRLLGHRRLRRSSSRLPTDAESQRLHSTPDSVQAHGLDVRSLLSSEGKGLVWASVAASDVLPGSGRHRALRYQRWAHAADARLEAMYAPELGGRSRAATLTIK